MVKVIADENENYMMLFDLNESGTLIHLINEDGKKIPVLSLFYHDKGEKHREIVIHDDRSELEQAFDESEFKFLLKGTYKQMRIFAEQVLRVADVLYQQKGGE